MSIYFDKADRTLLSMVNAALDNDKWDETNSFNPNLHPHGIIELTTTHEYRMAHAAVRLLTSLEVGQAETRLAALSTLHDEVMHSARTWFRYNTGRVLLQLMKDIVSTRHDPDGQLRLMHDFRKAASGNPLVVRRFLERCYLLEMPEDMSQLALDYHVHDANTKGRKNPTHLIMDAWIKGIRYLSVIYYNYIDSTAARELLQAAEIMGITVRIGIEFTSVFRYRFVNFVWTPRGFTDTEAFLAFLNEEPVKALMEEGKKASAWVAEQVFKGLRHWNGQGRIDRSERLGIPLPSVSEEDFSAYVGSGQASLLHLAEFLHKTYLPLITDKTDRLQDEYRAADGERRGVLDVLIGELDTITPEVIALDWLKPEANPELARLDSPYEDSGMPNVMTLPPQVLLDWLGSIRSGYRITLQLTNLTTEDVAELLWDGQGLITHLELFNLKEWQHGNLEHLQAINELQRAVNAKNSLHLKRLMLRMIASIRRTGDQQRMDKFKTILHNIATLQGQYRSTPLRTHIGTDSTSNSNVRHGMGLVLLETLPKRTQRILQRSEGSGGYRPIRVPINMELMQTRTITRPPGEMSATDTIVGLIRKLPGLSLFGMRCETGWKSISSRFSKKHPNVITMGGGQESSPTNNLRKPTKQETEAPHLCPAYLNTTLLGWLKVVAGFIPAQLAFLHTDGWWFLTYFGASLWYFITLGRNIIQAILSGGGLTHSMLTWREYVNWQRIADSLFFTGFSVLLLEVMVRRWLLENTIGYTVGDHAIVVYTVLAMCNSVYISTHNIIRGLPKQAVIGNLFRSVFAIPISWVLGECLSATFGLFGAADPAGMTQTCAAITSKFASDFVAAVIEGIADSNQNRRLRLWDYSTKLQQIFQNFTAIELELPEKDVLKLMRTPSKYLAEVEAVDPLRLRYCTLNALDLLYFWMYLPYAQQTLRRVIDKMTPEERVFLVRSQNILLNKKFVSRLFVDGLFGPNFSEALTFYLSQHEKYLAALKAMAKTIQQKTAAPTSVDSDGTKESEYDVPERSL